MNLLKTLTLNKNKNKNNTYSTIELERIISYYTSLLKDIDLSGSPVRTDVKQERERLIHLYTTLTKTLYQEDIT
jgi:hypothetical protein